MPREQHKWLDKDILDPEHAHELEKAAAGFEFGDKMPRKAAEERAYREYRHENHRKSAAFHLRGMKSSHGSGDMDAARKHGAMFETHMKALGHEPWKELPADVAKHMKAADEPVHRFRAHAGDRFVIDETRKSEAQNTLYRLWEKATSLAKAFPTDPNQPVGSHLEPKHRENIKIMAQTPEQLRAMQPSPVPGRRGIDQYHAQVRVNRIAAGNVQRPGTPARKGAIAGAHPDMQVNADALQEQGFKPETPPKFKPEGQVGRTGYRLPDAAIEAGINNRVTNNAHNPSEWNAPNQPALYVNEPWRGPANQRNSAYLDDAFWSSLGRMTKAEPLSVPPALQAKYKGAAKTSARLAATPVVLPNSTPGANLFRPGKPATKNTLKGAIPDQLVTSDALQEHGFHPERPPVLPPKGQYPGTATEFDEPGIQVPLQANVSNREQGLAQGMPSPLGASPDAPASIRGQGEAPWSGNRKPQSLILDRLFWESVGRAAGINKAELGHIQKPCPLCNEKQKNLSAHLESAHEFEMEGRRKNPDDPVVASLRGDTKKAELAPAPPAPAPVKPQLHSTVEGFLGGLHARPKGHPDRMPFVSAHANHTPLANAFASHPDPKVQALWGPFSAAGTKWADSKANAGFRPGHTVAMAKSEPTAFAQGQLAHCRGENHMIVKVHPGRALGQNTLYTLQHPSTQVISHAYESELAPAQG